MKKIVLFASLLMLLHSATAFAAGIGGRVGLTVQGGLAMPSDQADGTLDSNLGAAYGGSVLFGINNNVAAEIEVIHSRFDADLNGVKAAEFSSTDISLGGQYRFLGTAPMLQKVVPYLGAGVDIIFPDVEDDATADVDMAVGGHLKAGSDLFINSNFALNLELRGVLASKSNIRYAGATAGDFDPSNVLLLLGARVFF